MKHPHPLIRTSAMVTLFLVACQSRTGPSQGDSQIVSKVQSVWASVPQESDPKTRFDTQGVAVSAFLKQQWPQLTDAERTVLVSEVNKTPSNANQNFNYHLQSAILEIAIQQKDDVLLERLLARMDVDTIGYTPLEYVLVRDVDESTHLHRLSLLCVERAPDVAIVPTAAERSLRRANSQVCPEVQFKSDGEICQWMKANWGLLRIDPNYAEKLREWDGVTQAPPLLVARNP